MTARKTTKRKTSKKKTARSFLERNAEALSSGRVGHFVFTDAIKQDIDEANEARLAGTLHVPLLTICTLLKKEYNIPIAINTIRTRIMSYLGRNSW